MTQTVQIVGHQWCRMPPGAPVTDKFQIVSTLSGDLMVYCQKEKWHDLESGNGGVRMIPVKREDIPVVTT